MYRVILILGTIFLISSCRKLVQDEFSSPDLLPVVNAILIDGKPLEIHLSYPANINASTIGVIESAAVSLFINNVYSNELNYIDNGIYSSDVIVEEGNVYKCEIEIPNYETISCTDSIPKKSKVYEIEHINKAGKNEEGVAFPAVKITFENSTTSNQYFEVSLIFFSYGEASTASLEKITDPLIINEGLPIALFSNQLINDSAYQLILNYTTGYQSSSNGVWQTDLFPFIVELRYVSYNYYQYAKSMYLYEKGYHGNDLGTHISNFNTHSDVNGGYGIFAGFSAFQSDTIYPEGVQND